MRAHEMLFTRELNWFGRFCDGDYRSVIHTRISRSVSATYTSVRFASRTPVQRMRHVLLRVRCSFLQAAI